MVFLSDACQTELETLRQQFGAAANASMEYLYKVFLHLENGWYAPLPGAWLPGCLSPPEVHNVSISEPCASNSSTCGTENSTVEVKEASQEDVTRYEPWINDVERTCYVYVMPVICALSVILNSLTIFVLSRRNFRGSAFFLLMALAATDIVTSSLTFPYGWIFCSNCSAISSTCLFRLTSLIYVILPLTCISETTSAWLTSVMAMERYLAVRKPGRRSHTGNLRGRLLVSSVILAAVALNLPVFFVFRIEFDPNSGDFRKVFTEWALTSGYGVFCWTRAVLAQFLPLGLLIVLNVLLLKSINESRKRCRKMSASSQCGQQQTAQLRLTSMLVGTVILFVAGNVPIAFANSTLFDHVFSGLRVNRDTFASFRAVSHLLAMLSYALDFVVYCVSNRHFRNIVTQTAYDTLRPRSRKISDGSTLSTGTPPVTKPVCHDTPITVWVMPLPETPKKC